jgi:hypothetical protein
MRTTIDIDAGLLERAKRLALKDQRTLSSVVNNALSAYLGGRKSSTKEEPFELIVRGKPGDRFPTPADLAEVEENEELDSLKIAKRVRERAAP